MEVAAQSEHSKKGASWTLWIAALLICHPLSVGPFLYAASKTRLPYHPAIEKAFVVFYYPEIALTDALGQSHPMVRAFEAYVRWWEKL